MNGPVPTGWWPKSSLYLSTSSFGTIKAKLRAITFRNVTSGWASVNSTVSGSIFLIPSTVLAFPSANSWAPLIVRKKPWPGLLVAGSSTRVIDPATKSPGQGFFLTIKGAQEFADGKAKTVEGIKKIDPLTVEFTLAQP